MKTIAISVGGSLIAPKEIDADFIKSLRNIVNAHRDKRFIIVCGGGSICRSYQRAAGTLGASTEEMDWVGIFATYLNARLMASALGENKILKSPLEKIPKRRIVVASGWKPGWSTDYDAVILARRVGAKEIINLTNVPYVCDKDPNKFNDAKPVKAITWDEYRKICGNKWTPGANLPFDPVASREAQKAGLIVVIMKGLENLERRLKGSSFAGTTIKG